MSKGILAVVSGFSGAGKGTVTRALMERYSSYALSVSATTRGIREGEEDGVHYFFKTREEFEKMIAEGKLLEYAKYCDNYYGTPVEYVRKCIDEGRDVILEIEVQGALQVKEKFPESQTIFMTAPSFAELKNRLLSRGTESAEVIEQRLKRAGEESKYMPMYDYILVNEKVDECVETLHDIIQSSRCRAEVNKALVADIQNEISDYLGGI